jgi:phospholipid-binding lipoprotein MlaA
MMISQPFIHRFTILLVLFFLAGCASTRPQVSTSASVPESGEVQSNSGNSFDELDEFENEFDSDGINVADPLAGWNRMMFHFNDKFYFWILKPVAKGYRAVTPLQVRSGFGNFFHNIRTPIRFVNCLLQLKLHAAGEELADFITNSTVGMLGFVTPVNKRDGLASSNEDFGQTLGVYGMDNGFYIYWPFLGPSTLRDTIGILGDRLLDPVSWVDPTEVSTGISGFRVVNRVSLSAGEYEAVKKASISPYEAIRDTYLQYRSNQVSQ